MVKIEECKGCFHEVVCGKKDIFRMFCEQATAVAIQQDEGILTAKENDDVKLCLSCCHRVEAKEVRFW